MKDSKAVVEELDATAKFPAACALVKERSGTWAALKDEAGTTWLSCLPPKPPRARCLQLLELLAKLLAEVVDPLRIFRARFEPLSPVLGDRSAADIGAARDLAEYLQLPKPLLVKIDQHVEAARIRSHGAVPPATSGLSGRACDFVENAVLGSLIAAGSTALPPITARGQFSVASSMTLHPQVQEGLFGTHASRASRSFARDAASHYVGGLLAAKHAVDLRAIPGPYKGVHPKSSLLGDGLSMLPLSVAAWYGDVAALEVLEAQGFRRPSQFLAPDVAWLAAKAGHTDVMTWALAKPRCLAVTSRCQYPNWGYILGCERRFGILRACVAGGVDITGILRIDEGAASANAKDVLEWLETHHYPFTRSAWRLAQDPDTKVWLDERVVVEDDLEEEDESGAEEDEEDEEEAA